MKLSLFNIGFALFIGLFCLQSCTMETAVHFNEDESGSQILSVNMGDLMDMASSFGGGQSNEMEDVMSRFNAPEFADSLRMAEDSLTKLFAGTGADNFTLAFGEDGGISMGFDFADIETFDRIAKRSAEMENDLPGAANGLGGMSSMLSGMIGGKFMKKGKWLTIPFSQDQSLDDLMGNMPDNGEMSGQEMNDMMGMMEGFMGESIMFKYIYTFDKSIKKIKGDVPYTLDGNQLTVEYSLSDMIKWSEDDTDTDLKIKLK